MLQRLKGKWKVVFHTVLVLVVIFTGISIAALKWFSRDLPSMARLEMIEPALKTRILAADSTVIKEFYIQNRILLTLEKIPEEMQRAFLAIEDRRFYNHFGIDFIRLAAVAWKDLRHWNRREGASTITQQLSRDLFLTKEQTFPRKIKEALLALRIERTYAKDEILELYLNQIYFGAGTYGLEAASRKFFARPVGELELHQIALLAGLNKNPDGYNPFVNPERALRRRNVVLSAMHDFGVITSAQLDTLKALPLDVVQQELGRDGFASYFTEYIRQILAAKFGSQAIYREGYTVYTTLDPYLQRVAEDSLETYLQQLEREENYPLTRAAYLDSITAGVDMEPDYLQGAAVAIDPRTGFIKVMVGGRNFEESEYNRAIQASRQPGSAFKLFIYITALESGYSPSDILLDTPLVVELPHGEVYKPRNFTEKFHGAVSLRYALNESINVPAIKLLQKIGAPSVIGVARRMGIKSPLRPYLSLALGAQEVNLLELTTAFGVLAAGGVRAEPIAILKIEDRNGNVLEEHREYHEEVLSPDISYIITDMLKTVVDEGTGKTVRMMGLNIPCAGKTGTTDDYTDGWFIGFTPELAVGAWTGFDEKITMGRNRTGARVALPIWVDIMRAAYSSRPAPDFLRPENITEAMICEESGLLATPYCEAVRKEIFIEGMEPMRQCDLHRVSPYDLLDPDKDFREMDKDALQDTELPRPRS
jgi:penicillin-binding protein 1A